MYSMRPCESELNVVVCTHPGPQLQLPEGGAGRRPLSSLSWCLMYSILYAVYTNQLVKMWRMFVYRTDFSAKLKEQCHEIINLPLFFIKQILGTNYSSIIVNLHCPNHWALSWTALSVELQAVPNSDWHWFSISKSLF